MPPIRPVSRIRPYRSTWSRSRMLAVGVGVVAIAALAVTAWAPGRARTVVELDPAGAYRVRSSAGPVQLSHGDRPLVDYRTSALLTSPRVATGPASVTIDCPGGLPCRAAAEVRLPATASAAIEVIDAEILVDDFAGPLSVTTTGSSGEVYLGPVPGAVDVTTDAGAIHGHGLTGEEAALRTSTGPIEVRFAARPRSVVASSDTGPVLIVLPDGDYAVTVRGEPVSVSIEVAEAAASDSRILVETEGPVIIRHPPPDDPTTD